MINSDIVLLITLGLIINNNNTLVTADMGTNFITLLKQVKISFPDS